MSFEGGFAKNKKKKKRSYLTRAKKFGKSGRFGKGSFISEDIYNYFLRVIELDRAGFPTDEEREMFVSNTFQQVEGQEPLLATNQLTSVALERLITTGKDECVIKFMTALGQDMRPIVNDPFASHVFQSLLKKCALRIQELKGEEDSKEKEQYTGWILKVGKFLMNNFEDFNGDQYANQIMRTVLETCSGAEPVLKDTKVKVTKPLKEFFKDFCLYIQKLPQLTDMVSVVLTSSFLQTLVKCSNLLSSKLFIPLAEKLLSVLEERKASNKMAGPAWRLVEAILIVKHPEINQAVYEKFFKGSMTSMAIDPEMNFSVQRLLENCPTKEKLDEILEEINSVENIEKIIASSYYGVVRAIGVACKNLSTNQGSFCQSLIGALHCNVPTDRQNSLASLVLSFKDFEKFEHFQMMNEDQNLPITMQGSLLLQACLNYNKPIKFAQSILSMEAASLLHIFSDPKGSHVCDAFMNSKFIGEKSREKLCHSLKGHLVELCCSKFGSRCFDSIWSVSPLKTRQTLAKELSNGIPRLKGDQFGRFIITKYGVELFKHSPEDWTAAQSKDMKTKKLFADILGEEEPPSKKSKK